MSAKEKTTGFIAEFRQFIARGNVLDMAVGVVIGGAFGKITTSLVNVISMLTGGVDFASWKWVLKQAVVENGEEISAAVSVNYGTLIATVLDFLIISLVIFCLIKTVNKLHRKKEEAPAPDPEPSNEEVLLTEIRDLLKQRQ